MIRIQRHPLGRRVYVFGFRVHHGLVCALGTVLCALGVIHDRRDFPWPMKDRER